MITSRQDSPDAHASIWTANQDALAEVEEHAPSLRSRPIVITALTLGVTLAVVSTIQSVFLNVAKDRPADVWRTLGIHTASWVVWALLLPTIFKLCARWPIRYQTLHRVWWRYCLLVMGAPVLHSALVVLPVAWLRGWFDVGQPVTVSFEFVYVNGAVNTMLQFVLIVTGCQAVIAARIEGSRQLAASRVATLLAEAELRALRAQLQPHFLFNTLNAIAAYVRDAPDIAESMIEQLSSLLRLVLQATATNECTLRQELTLVRNYLAIHEIRYGGRLSVTYDIDARAEMALVPSMLLQPLAENAITHGIADHPGPGHIGISARVTDSMLILGVWNSGISDASTTTRGKSTGIGMANSRARLEQLYGAHQALEFRIVDGGTLVEARFPLRWATKAVAERGDMPSSHGTSPAGHGA